LPPFRQFLAVSLEKVICQNGHAAKTKTYYCGTLVTLECPFLHLLRSRKFVATELNVSMGNATPKVLVLVKYFTVLLMDVKSLGRLLLRVSLPLSTFISITIFFQITS
jgi:hypothetical protein